MAAGSARRKRVASWGRWAVAALVAVVLGPIGAAQAEAPHVTVDSPVNGSVTKDTTPSFSGHTDDPLDEVTLTIYSEGVPLQTLSGLLPAGEIWSAGPAEPLSDGLYTAQASETNLLIETGRSEPPVTFEVDTNPPTVTLKQPQSPSNNTRPTFSGTASDTTPVTVHIFNAAEAEVASATASGGGSWTSGQSSSSLSTGRYTAYATEPSSLGNPEGRSEQVSFEVDTNPPTVTLDQPLPHSNNPTPTFTGTASDTTLVTVKVYLGTKASGTLVSEATALPSGGSWESGRATLKAGKFTYTAIASQESSLHNPTGVSSPVTFAVDTAAPSVTLNAPVTPTDDATPSFTGTATETNPVSVQIYAGSTISGAPVAAAEAVGTGGVWASGPVAPRLADGEYMAVATQPSSYGHEPGGAGPVGFVVDTVAPQVTLASPSDGSTFSGGTVPAEGSAGKAAGDVGEVTLQLFSGPQIEEGAVPAQSVRVPAINGHWVATLAGLAPGSYVVRVVQADTAGNLGVSTPAGFSVLTSAAAVTPLGPSVGFSWTPTTPHTGETVSLLSSSTDSASPITGYAWDLAGSGVFSAGGPVTSTSFTTPGGHVVQLRVTDAAGASNVVAEAIQLGGASLSLMQPFPTVRITASRRRSGVRLRLLSIRAPAGARVAVKCTGRGCPVKSQSRTVTAGRGGAPAVAFHRFERFLRSGTILEIRVFRLGEIGKYTRFTVRRGRLPSRSDACVSSVAVKPIACPSR